MTCRAVTSLCNYHIFHTKNGGIFETPLDNNLIKRTLITDPRSRNRTTAFAFRTGYMCVTS